MSGIARRIASYRLLEFVNASASGRRSIASWTLADFSTGRGSTADGGRRLWSVGIPRRQSELLVRLSGQYDPEDFADQLLLLREDLRDPVLRARGDSWMQTLIAAIERRLVRRSRDQARVAGLGLLVIAQWQGTLTVWSFMRPAPLKDAVQSALEDLFRRLRINV